MDAGNPAGRLGGWLYRPELAADQARIGECVREMVRRIRCVDVERLALGQAVCRQAGTMRERTYNWLLDSIAIGCSIRFWNHLFADMPEADLPAAVVTVRELRDRLLPGVRRAAAVCPAPADVLPGEWPDLIFVLVASHLPKPETALAKAVTEAMLADLDGLGLFRAPLLDEAEAFAECPDGEFLADLQARAASDMRRLNGRLQELAELQEHARVRNTRTSEWVLAPALDLLTAPADGRDALHRLLLGFKTARLQEDLGIPSSTAGSPARLAAQLVRSDDFDAGYEVLWALTIDRILLSGRDGPADDDKDSTATATHLLETMMLHPAKLRRASVPATWDRIKALLWRDIRPLVVGADESHRRAFGTARAAGDIPGMLLAAGRAARAGMRAGRGTPALWDEIEAPMSTVASRLLVTLATGAGRRPDPAPPADAAAARPTPPPEPEETPREPLAAPFVTRPKPARPASAPNPAPVCA